MKRFTKIPGRPIGTVAAQLRKSFLIINCAVAVFFIIYLLQAYFLYERSNIADQQVIHTNDVLNNIKNADADNQKVQSSLANYFLTHDKAYVTKANRHVADLKKDISNLLWLASDNKILQQKIVDFSRLADKKMALTEKITTGHTSFSNTDDLISLDESINNALSKMESNELNLLALNTNKNRYYSKSRVIFSLVSYVLVTVFLLLAFYKINQNIKKRTDAEEKAKLNEEKYRSLVEGSGLNMLVMNRKGVISFASNNIQKLTGHEPGDYIGVPFTMCMPADFRNQVVNALSKATEKENVHSNFELQLFTTSGEQKCVSCNVFPVNRENNDEQEWQVIFWDIEDEKKMQLEIGAMEDERKKHQKLIQDIIDNIPAAFYVKDIDGRYLMINHKIEELIGKNIDEVIGKTDKDLVKETAKYLEIKHSDDEVLAYKKVTKHEEAIEVNGVTTYHLITKFPLFDENGNVKNICGIATDITEQKENELKLIDAKKDAEKARIAQETFLANMSHEIRTPMNGIIGMGNLMLSTPLNQEQQEFTENIQESARNLLAIINDILDFSKIKSGKFRFEHTAFRLKSTIKKAIYPLTFKAEEKMIKLGLHVEEGLPEVLIGDPIRLQQIIINLAGNAIKFTSNGSVDIHVLFGEVKDGKMAVRVDVKDTGIGIAQSKLDYIFESFTQNNENTSRKYGGTGLGLAIVRQLVELQDGHVSATSTLGLGSTFSVVIPFEIGTEADTKDNKVIGNGDQKDLLGGIKILVAEDNTINQKVVKNTLQKQGANVMIVSNGKEAVDQMRENSYDVVLMDLQMPEVDGYKATRYIRQVLKNDVPIFAMTADALKGEAEKCYEAGMTGFISKPFEPNELYLQILEVTREKNIKNILSDKKDTTMAQPIVDFSFLYEISDNDPQYISDVIDIFLGTMPDGLVKLEDLIRNTDDWDAIYKQAHFLKSSVSVVKVRDMFDNLGKIEALAKQHDHKEEIVQLLDTILATFKEAEPVVLAEKENSAAQK